MIYWLIAILPFTALNVFTLSGEDVLLTYFAAIILFFLLTAHILIFSKYRYKLYFDSPLKYFTALLLFIFLANLGGIGKPAKYYTQYINLMIIFISFFTFSNLLYRFSQARIKKVIDFFVLVSVGLALFSIYQYFAAKYGLPGFDYFRNSNMYYVARDWRAGSGWITGARAYGVAPEPTFWAAFIFIPISIMLPRILQLRFDLKNLLVFAILNISFFLAFARSSWITYVAIIFIYFLYNKLKMRVHPYLLVFVSIVLVLISNLIFFLFPAITGLSYYMRIVGSLTALKMFVSSPLIGLGWGSFQHYFIEYRMIPDFASYWVSQLQFNAGFASNLYLRILSEAGLIGLVLFMAIIIAIFNRMTKLIDKEPNQDNVMLYHGLMLSFYSILIYWFYSEAYNLLYIWFIFAIMSVLPNIFKKEEIAQRTDN